MVAEMGPVTLFHRVAGAVSLVWSAGQSRANWVRVSWPSEDQSLIHEAIWPVGIVMAGSGG